MSKAIAIKTNEKLQKHVLLMLFAYTEAGWFRRRDIGWRNKWGKGDSMLIFGHMKNHDGDPGLTCTRENMTAFSLLKHGVTLTTPNNFIYEIKKRLPLGCPIERGGS